MRCVKCNMHLTNCETCVNANFCDTCFSGFYMKSDNTGCLNSCFDEIG